MIIIFVLLITNWPIAHNYYYPFIPLGSFISLWTILYSNSRRHTWGNRPVISAENRQQRIYVYQDGLIKQTRRHCEVVRWPEVFEITYAPPQLPNAQEEKGQARNTTRMMAGLIITRHGGHKLSLSGALSNIDTLATHLNYHTHSVQKYG